LSECGQSGRRQRRIYRCRCGSGTCEGEGRVERGVAGGQVGVGVVSALVIVVLDVEAVELGVLDAQGAARVVDVLPVQRLQPQKTISPFVLPAEGFLFERLATSAECE